MRTIAITNQKGGVGKTTSAVNISAGLARMNYKVMVIDLDPQASLTYSLGIQADDLETTVCELIKGEVELEKVAIEKNNLTIVPSSIHLSSTEIELSTKAGRETVLKDSLHGENGFDFVILDCPPNLGFLTLNALTVAEEVFVPLQAEFLSIKGLSKILEMIQVVKERLNSSLEFTGLLVTQYNHRLKLYNEVLEELRKHFSDQLFNVQIRRNIALAEASSFGQAIYDYDSHSIGAEDYMALCREIEIMET